MPNITLKTKYLMELLGSNISLDKLTAEIYKMGFEVEHADNEEIKIEITPNRPDLLGAIGMARSLRNFLHNEKSFDYQIKDKEPEVRITVDKSVKGTQSFIAGLVAHNVSLTDESLADLFAFLDKFCDNFGRGRRKISNGVYNLKAVGKELTYTVVGDEKIIPLNEKAPQKFSQILKQNEKGLKYGSLIDEKKGYPMLSDSEGPLALIPIINADRTKVTQKTSDLLIDVTGTSRHLVEKTVDMLACLLKDLGARVGTVEVTYPEMDPEIYPKMEPRVIITSLAKLESEIGVKIGFNNILSLAAKMGYTAAFVDNKIRFNIPEYRLDIINEQDIIEDIAIAYGYDFIQPVQVPSIAPGILEDSTLMFDKISDAIVGMGFTESMSSYLSNEETNFKMMNTKPYKPTDYVGVKDARVSSITMLRTSILPSLLNVAKASKHDKMPQKIFELDMAFNVKGSVDESYYLSMISVDPKSNLNYIKGISESLSKLLGWKLFVTQKDHQSFIPGRCASLSLNGKEIGFFGELHPEVLSNFGIEEPTVALEIKLS